MSEYPTAPTEDAVREVLRQFDIPVDRWGSISAKTVANLLGEIEAGETTQLKMDKNYSEKQDLWRLI